MRWKSLSNQKQNKMYRHWNKKNQERRRKDPFPLLKDFRTRKFIVQRNMEFLLEWTSNVTVVLWISAPVILFYIQAPNLGDLGRPYFWKRTTSQLTFSSRQS